MSEAWFAGRGQTGLENGVEPRLEQPRARLGPDQPEDLRVSVHSSNCQDTALDQHQQQQECLAASGAGSSATDLAAQAPWQQQQQAARSALQRQKQAASRGPQPSAEVPVAVTPMANGLQQGGAAAGSTAGSSSAPTGDSASTLRPEPASPVTPASGMEDSRRGPFMRGLHSLRRGSQTPPASTYSAQGMAPSHSTLVSAAHDCLTLLCPVQSGVPSQPCPKLQQVPTAVTVGQEICAHCCTRCSCGVPWPLSASLLSGQCMHAHAALWAPAELCQPAWLQAGLPRGALQSPAGCKPPVWPPPRAHVGRQPGR